MKNDCRFAPKWVHFLANYEVVLFLYCGWHICPAICKVLYKFVRGLENENVNKQDLFL